VCLAEEVEKGHGHHASWLKCHQPRCSGAFYSTVLVQHTSSTLPPYLEHAVYTGLCTRLQHAGGVLFTLCKHGHGTHLSLTPFHPPCH
jgi:hypothetical protein